MSNAHVALALPTEPRNAVPFASLRRWLRRAAPWALPVAILAVWQLASQAGWLSTRILPEPWAVAKAFAALWASGEMQKHVATSTWRALTGLAIGGGLGLTLGLVTGSFRRAETLLDSTLQMVRNIPPLALIPLVILWFGIDEAAKLFLVAFGVFFPVYLNTFHGIRAVDPALIEMAKSYGLSGGSLYRHVILPGALPNILVGLRFALGLMWVLLIVAETISAQAGIGYMTMNAREFLQTDVVLVGILLYALLGKLADVLARGLERWGLRWHPGYQHAPLNATTTMNTLELEVTEFWAAPARRQAVADEPAAALRRESTAPRGTPITLQGVRKRYGTREVLRGLDLSIAAGQFVAVVGRSGCGKSTLLRLLAGLERFDAGRIGTDDAGDAAAPDALRVMFQDARLLPWKRVLDNVALGLRGDDARDRAREALAQVGLADRAHDWPAVLSGGQRQRVALARALVHTPRLLLLDEPLGALDALTRIEMQRLIESLWRQHGFTALLVTHDVAEAVALADRIVLIEDGRIALDEAVDLPRPRQPGDARAAAIEAVLLGQLLGGGDQRRLGEAG